MKWRKGLALLLAAAALLGGCQTRIGGVSEESASEPSSKEEEWVDPAPNEPPRPASKEERPPDTESEPAEFPQVSSAAPEPVEFNTEGLLTVSDKQAGDIIQRTKTTILAIAKDEPIRDGIEDLVWATQDYALKLDSLQIHTDRIQTFKENFENGQPDSFLLITTLDQWNIAVELYQYPGGDEFRMERIYLRDGRVQRSPTMKSEF